MKIKTTLALLIATSVLAGCSQVNQSIKSVTKLGSQEESYSDSQQSSLVVPPALALPSGVVSANSYQARNTASTNSGQSRKNSYVQPNSNQQSRRTNAPTRSAPSALSSNKNYYVVVGTYPDSEQAMDTFVRLSSIGLPNATMESRVTKSGKSLHMVRLGPFTRQAQIDKIKDNLMSDGLTQFKVVES